MRKACLILIPALWGGCAGRADLGGNTAPGAGGSDGASRHVPDAAALSDATVIESTRSLDAATDARTRRTERDAGSDARSVGPVDASPDVGASTGRPRSCDDDKKDGDETDIDCGGSCLPCGIEQHCLVNSDCGSSPGCDPAKGGCACDAISSTCVYDHCSDRKLDGTETAVDCGGECPGCGLGQACLVDTDCSETASGCDVDIGGCFCDGISLTCVSTHCDDHKLDNSETAVDCGGGACSGCALGQACGLDFDCTSMACDGVSAVCVGDSCLDHRQDGTETNVDCGGDNAACARCPLGKKCLVTSDCVAGGTCSAISGAPASDPHLCQ
jgi:hypothetical protein